MQIKTVADIADIEVIAPSQDITVFYNTLTCTNTMYYLEVYWKAHRLLTENFRVFVHGISAEGVFILQADQPAPVYTWRPTTTWRINEVIRDIYPLPRPDETTIHTIRYGMYRITADGGFDNVSEYEIRATC